MKCTLLLLAAMVGAVCGAELGAEIQGVTSSGPPCTAEQDQVLYKECVEDVAVFMGLALPNVRLSSDEITRATRTY
jgi:hypothetical protein